MRDYADQIARLRECASNSHEVHLKCGAYLSGVCAKTRDIRMQDAADAIEELLDELTTIRKQLPRWASVEERLPEDFQKVLVFWWEHSEPMVDTAFWQKDAKRFDGEHWVRMEDKVTHWMPLPAPPKGVLPNGEV